MLNNDHKTSAIILSGLLREFCHCKELACNIILLVIVNSKRGQIFYSSELIMLFLKLHKKHTKYETSSIILKVQTTIKAVLKIYIQVWHDVRAKSCRAEHTHSSNFA